ncbi:hypothetical protein J3458_021391 [Metarhizium acridum]|uniref:uncharacterized protein n=1 Tax=Metarhizium acridum TaxID=92637 RepID=UPI001C6A9A6C|nr:hypothetical protein J3458_021391 [Metarhizium acridum]
MTIFLGVIIWWLLQVRVDWQHSRGNRLLAHYMGIKCFHGARFHGARQPRKFHLRLKANICPQMRIAGGTTQPTCFASVMIDAEFALWGILGQGEPIKVNIDIIAVLLRCRDLIGTVTFFYPKERLQASSTQGNIARVYMLPQSP